MKTQRHTARRTLVRSALAGLALVIAIPTVAIAAHPFTDVPGGQWFSDAVDWAYDNNITTGVSPTEFGGDQGFTRYQAVTMLERMDDNIIQPGLEGAHNRITGVRNDMSDILHAVVNQDGSLQQGSSTDGVSSVRNDTGKYELRFPIEVRECAWQATIVTPPFANNLVLQPDPWFGAVGLAPDFDSGTGTDLKGIYVETWDQSGLNVDRNFTVTVMCTPLDGFNGPVVSLVPSVPIQVIPSP
jgi:hypothetical protein